MDGIIDGTTAALKEPYNVNYGIYPQNKGDLDFSISKFSLWKDCML